jgi:hypothetical protein
LLSLTTQDSIAEFSLNYLIDHELDTRIFHDHYKNDDMGCLAYDPALLLKIVLLAYSRGVTSSRKIEQLCRENVVFMALSANTQPHFTTIADFISRSTEEISQLFLQVLMVCDFQGLLQPLARLRALRVKKVPFMGTATLLAVRCLRLMAVNYPTTPAKNGHADLRHKKQKIDKAIRYILNKYATLKSTDLPCRQFCSLVHNIYIAGITE